MTSERFEFRKEDEYWLSSKVNGSKPKHSKHSSRVKALNAFFARHPNIKRFLIILPSGEGDGN